MENLYREFISRMTSHLYFMISHRPIWRSLLCIDWKGLIATATWIKMHSTPMTVTATRNRLNHNRSKQVVHKVLIWRNMQVIWVIVRCVNKLTKVSYSFTLRRGVCCGSNDEITVLGHYSYRQTTGKRVICGFGQNSQHSGLDSKKMQINAYNCIY